MKTWTAGEKVNASDLNGNFNSVGGVYISNETITGGNFTVPAGTTRTIVAITTAKSGYEDLHDEITLMSAGKTTGVWGQRVGSTFIEVSLSWSGSAITPSVSGADSYSLTAYYYK